MQETCESLAFYGVNTQSVIQSFLKTPVCGASLSHGYPVTSSPSTHEIFNCAWTYNKKKYLNSGFICDWEPFIYVCQSINS